ncbi:MAG: HD-GYP domain-containing protein [Sulfurimicrobium sp.]|nr:HD-GYP domain-containing protein [Sulfurimicrobium sp.]MDP2199192.1 HD-GYP domain-containing protein [Sulfurimicrobium sp.]MDP2962805.1 HD-GYP domain-containing protein [Sulfurimicrobium sp.]MDP3686414.1 HD-GYP domain-containing protein [Sulfurimicrobium sp.]MDZ7655777.1 HD-GYP domain-containing protein [Sulfurimicrobium sp.]
MIKKIDIEQLIPGMYIHDLNCGWMDHPFATNRFTVKDEKVAVELRGIGVRELYIDTDKGLDIAEAKTQEEVSDEIQEQILHLAEEKPAPIIAVTLAEEAHRAKKLHGDANRIVKEIITDIRLGQQIEMEKVEPLVENMVDSIFRHQDALIPLARLKTHDEYTFQHSVSVCALMVAFARGLSLSRDIIKEIAIGALLHDVGKAKVPDSILNKPAKLTDAEFGKMKSHVVQSIIILQNTPGISQIALDVAGQHHERFDGTGYPNKLKGDEISLYGQMGAIVDVYDAITSDRVYHKGMPPTEALKKLLEWSKFHFDPEMVQTFIRTLGIYPSGSLVRLSNNRLGIVLEQNAEKMLQPKVKVFYHADKQHYLPPEELDLARASCQEKIVSHESFEKWGIDPAKWLPS